MNKLKIPDEIPLYLEKQFLGFVPFRKYPVEEFAYTDGKKVKKVYWYLDRLGVVFPDYENFCYKIYFKERKK